MLFDANATSLPSRSELPQISDAPKGAAWFWGKEDELGRLNLLTPDRTAAAAKLIRTGQVVNLNLQADLPSPPIFGREPFKHNIKKISPGGYDDLYHCNTQSGSQWDGFRHVGHEHGDDRLWYNGLTRNELLTTSRCGMQAWANHGIVGRGVLLDYWNFAKESYDPNTSHRITLPEILACAKYQNVTFQYGDVLLIRSGWLSNYLSLSQSAREALPNAVPTFVGIAQETDMLDFMHDNYFSAVAGDAPAFEAWPTNQDWRFHEHFLACWGMPIGEMWDLEKLSEVCKEKKQWEFYFSSMPANVPGGVASVPNALAVF